MGPLIYDSVLMTSSKSAEGLESFGIHGQQSKAHKRKITDDYKGREVPEMIGTFLAPRDISIENDQLTSLRVNSSAHTSLPVQGKKIYATIYVKTIYYVPKGSKAPYFVRFVS